MKKHKLFTLISLIFMLFALLFSPAAAAENDYQRLRSEMVDLVQNQIKETADYHGQKKLNPRVLEAMSKVPRHEFVPEEYRPYAYDNRPLPIGHGQTISQPYIVAIMTDLLNLEPNAKVLEIGTGSAYQAAVLAEVAADVYTIEIIEALAKEAQQRLKRLGYTKVHTRSGDGYYGWEEAAPFDGIVVTAAASHIPPPLVKQLKPGGRMIIPVGDRFNVQQLVLVEKDRSGKIITRQLLPVAFVPLTGKHP